MELERRGSAELSLGRVALSGAMECVGSFRGWVQLFPILGMGPNASFLPHTRPDVSVSTPSRDLVCKVLAPMKVEVPNVLKEKSFFWSDQSKSVVLLDFAPLGRGCLADGMEPGWPRRSAAGQAPVLVLASC